MTEHESSMPAHSETVVELEIDGQRYCLQLPNAGTDYIQKKVATEKQPYEREMLDEMRRLLKPGDLVIDAGANVGNHTLYLAALAGCRVEAFEPNPSLAAAIRASATLNGLDARIRVHQLGLGAHPGRRRFDAERPENLGARKLILDGDEVEIVALDSIEFDAPVKALKIDVEGMEIDVLCGAAKLVARDRPVIYVECIGDRDFRQVARWLDAHDYVHWDTFNATPTHQFMPSEAVSMERRLARLQLNGVRDDYRQTALATNVRQKLTHAFDNERQAKERSAALAQELALRDAEVKQLNALLAAGAAALEEVRTELTDTSGRFDRERRKARATEVANQAALHEAQVEVSVAKAEIDTARAAADDARDEIARFKASIAAVEQRLQDTLAEGLRTHDALRVCAAERDEARQARDQTESTLIAIRADHAAAAAKLEVELTQERDGALRANADNEAALAKLRSEKTAADQKLAAMLIAERTLQQQLAALTREGELLRRTITDGATSAQRLRDERQKLQHFLEAKSARLDTVEAHLKRTRSSGKYLVGTALAASTRSIGDAFKLPQRLWRIYRDSPARRALGTPTTPLAPARTRVADPGSHRTAPTAPAPASVPLSAQPPARRNEATETVAPTAGPKPAGTQPEARSPRKIDNLRQLRVACIADEFTYHSFAPECELLQLRSDTWKAQLQAFSPDLVFIESAWRGVADSWQRKVSDVSPELVDLIEWAMLARIPTAFWCKEDPVHFVRFLPVARMVDHVFTTDIDCIPRYMAALRHERVHLLPFAAQPALHNPIESFPREDAFCFAGSFYRKYPERQADFQALVKVARRLRSLVIYDRNSNRPQPHDFNYPDEFRSELRDALDYAEVDRAYKGFRFGITVNTIKHSQSMFARRAFELMACNTVVVSNFSRGLRLLFADLVVASDNAGELAQRLTPVCNDERHYRALRLRALRSVLGQHTYSHRLAYVVSRIEQRLVAPPRPKVAVVAEVANAADAERAATAMNRQTWRDAELLLVGPVGSLPPAFRALPDRNALAATLDSFDHVAVFDVGDYYGPEYLTDLALATSFARDDGVTKSAFYRAEADGSTLLQGDGRQYKVVAAATLRRSLVRTAAFRRTLASTEGRLGDAEARDGRFVGLDEFSYCASAMARGGAFDITQVEASGTGQAPPDYVGTVQRAAEAISMPAGQTNGGEPHFKLSANDLARLLPKQVDPRLRLSRDAQQRVVVESSLEPGQHSYLYLNRRFEPGELTTAAEMRFEIEVDNPSDAPLNLCTVFVFRNSAEQKISQLTDPVGKPHALRVPAGTDHVRLALRVQGPGRAVLGRLRIAPALREPTQAIPTVDHLVVVRNYPAYDDLYRYAFVHARVRAYARAGQPAHVLCLGRKPRETTFREFEDVDVIDADATTFDHFLATRSYKHVLVHIADPDIWELVSKHLDKLRVTIWVHGAEIQPWWRRAFGEPDTSNEWARQTNDVRLAMWREILRMRHPNLTLVFISHKQLRETLSDLRLRAAQLGHAQVIHNFVDTERFNYRPKPAAQRMRVLSIRPYSSPVYGNDLAVQAIQRLAREPFFGELEFRLVGDGKLFDETVAPLRGFDNVEISKGFITQAQIAELHRDYGIFLVPSRMDSQGVSRDEAMSSGLVPVTSRIAAIPDFVDASCGFLAEPEDASGLASAIATLYHDPQRFEAMSAAAAQRVRGQSGYEHTVARELALLEPRRSAGDSDVAATLSAEEDAHTHIAVYGDVNLNIVDGSAVWAASLAETLATADGVRVMLLLKARVKRTLMLSRLLDLAPRVQLIEPQIRENEALAPAQAVAEIAELATLYPLRAVVLRGLQVCDEATRIPSLRGRIWAYLTDIPQRAEAMDDATRTRIASIVEHSEFVLCQTPQMEAYLLGLFPTASGRTRILPPMIPPAAEPAQAPVDAAFRLAYAGKFAPSWGIEELFQAFGSLRAALPGAELHVYGDKIHQSNDRSPNFRQTVEQRLTGGDGLHWHRAVDRAVLMRELRGMHACWAFRDPAFERDCLELSTKALEYAALQLPVILARNEVNESVFGADYALFADSAAHAAQLLQRLAVEPAFRNATAQALARVASRFEFAAVRASLQANGMLPALSG
jgi:FkbM family methyltransferase